MKIVGLIAVSFGLMALVSIPEGFIIKWCWNYSVVPTCGVKEVTWQQAWCLAFMVGSMVLSGKTGVTSKAD